MCEHISITNQAKWKVMKIINTDAKCRHWKFTNNTRKQIFHLYLQSLHCAKISWKAKTLHRRIKFYSQYNYAKYWKTEVISWQGLYCVCDYFLSYNFYKKSDQLVDSVSDHSIRPMALDQRQGSHYLWFMHYLHK